MGIFINIRLSSSFILTFLHFLSISSFGYHLLLPKSRSHSLSTLKGTVFPSSRSPLIHCLVPQLHKMTPLRLFTEKGTIPPDVVEPIAVVGLATRLPQEATTTDALWELLLEARSTWSAIPKERFNADAFYHPDPEHGGTVSAHSWKTRPPILTLD